MSIKLSEKIIHVGVDEIAPYERNARVHSDVQIEMIASSIAEFGFTNPLLCDKDLGLIAGHGRLEAAKQLGMETVPVIILDHLDELQKRALILADNRIAELSTWDEKLLAIELSDLRLDDYDIDITGFDDGYLDAITSNDDDDEDERPSKKEKRSSKIKCPKCGHKFKDE